ncbi:MAG TPA: NAD(P)H-dependent glycerol-3-phosphate dehydrogenase [Dehalococcoidales bacterium]|nr:NAD(P)H-dependent glycerol-3-phosphate dehydrogenase [Dehalococcoidales bacterium]
MAGVAVIGTTTWGVTLGVVLARNDIDVRLWARTEQECSKLQKGQHHAEAVSAITLPPRLSIMTSLPEVLEDADAIILAVPSQSMRDNIKAVSAYLKSSVLVVSAAKGLEISSNKRMSQVIADEISPGFWPNICVYSGPNLSAEILQGLPAVAVVAAWNELIARKAQKMLSNPSICLYTNSDVIGVELGGALKNIIALGAGIADGLGFGDNAKAALITRGLTEMTALGVALGANPLTFSGLTGLGDLITTCSSPLSRNHHVGVELTKGRKLDEILKSMSGVAEGVSTTVVAHKLAKQLELEMPITEKIYRVLYEGLDPRQASLELMEAEARHELMGRRWRLFSLFRH